MFTTTDAIVEVFKRWDIDIIFGCPGTTEIPFLESLKSHSNIKYVTAYLDGVAVAMADGYARSRRKVAITNLHATQGTLNAYGLIRAALRDESPIVIISGLPSHSYELVEPTHFVYGLADILRKVTKFSWQVNSPDQTVTALNRAIEIALTPPFGPTFIGIPQDVMVQKVSDMSFSLHRMNNIKNQALEIDIDKFVKIIRSSKKPVILAGKKAGESKSQEELADLARLLGAPLISEAPDRGPQVYTVHMDYNDPLFLGYYSNTDKFISNYLSTADLVIEIGCKQTYNRIIKEVNNTKKIVQIQETPHELGKYHMIEYGLSGDIKTNISLVNTRLIKTASLETLALKKRLKQIKKITEKRLSIINRTIRKVKLNTSKILPIHLVLAMAEVLPKDSIFIDEAQTFSWFLKKYFPFTLKNIAYGTNASHIGWGLPFSAGAAFYHKDKKIICIVSDSAFLMGVQTLGTLAKHKLPVVILVINNGGFSSLKLEYNNYSKKITNNIDELNLNDIRFNYSEIASGMGIKSFLVSKQTSLRKTLFDAISHNGPVLIDVQFDEANDVWKDGWYLAPPK